ncbi:MAG: hypothetical protein Q9195_004178 [Heterodermia aff. obscurata]
MPLTFSSCWIRIVLTLVTIFSSTSALAVPKVDLIKYQHAPPLNHTADIQKIGASTEIISSFAKPALSLPNRTVLTEHFTYYEIRVRGTETTLEIRHDADEELNLSQRDHLFEWVMDYYRFRLNTHGDGRLAHRDAQYRLVSLPTREIEFELSAWGSELTYEVAYDALLGVDIFFHNYPGNRGAIIAIIKNPTISDFDPETGQLEPIGYVIIRRNEGNIATTA